MFVRTAALAAIVVFSAANVEAMLIDSFNAGSQSTWVSSSQQNASCQAVLGSGAAIGGYRNIAMQWLSGAKSYIDVLTDPGWTGLSFTQGTGQAETTVTWDGANSPSILTYSLAANLTSGGATEFLLDVAQATGSGVDLNMIVYTDATHASEYAYSVPSGTGNVVSMPYGGFSQVGANGPADFSSVGAVVLVLNGSGHPGSDITINSIETVGAAVPEPSTFGMAAVGAMVFFGLRWRRKRA